MTETVFIIHDVMDKPFARQLAIDLSLAGATAYLDEAEIGGDQDSLVGYVVRGVFDDVCLVVVLSPHLVGSDWLQQELASLLNLQGGGGSSVNVLPVLYKDCVIPALLADKPCADFRNPLNYSSKLGEAVDRLELGRNGKGNMGPSSLEGIWQGSWIWCGRQRDADMFLSASPEISSKMIVRYLKSGVLTLVEQKLDMRITGNAVKLIGTGYRMLERGMSLGWNLDTFNLSLDATGMTLEGILTDKRGIESPVVFKRK